MILSNFVEIVNGACFGFAKRVFICQFWRQHFDLFAFFRARNKPNHVEHLNNYPMNFHQSQNNKIIQLRQHIKLWKLLSMLQWKSIVFGSEHEMRVDEFCHHRTAHHFCVPIYKTEIKNLNSQIEYSRRTYRLKLQPIRISCAHGCVCVCVRVHAFAIMKLNAKKKILHWIHSQNTKFLWRINV